MHIWKKNVKMNMGINFWKKNPHIHVCIMNHWDVYTCTLLYRGLGEGKWMCISSSACMHVYQCDYPAHHSDSTLLLENKPFVGIVTQRVLCSIRRKIKHVINSNTVISHANTRLEVNIADVKIINCHLHIVFIKNKCNSWNIRFKKFYI